jgi:TRAP-type C4-dicarboxylate transport system, small permease component
MCILMMESGRTSFFKALFLILGLEKGKGEYGIMKKKPYKILMDGVAKVEKTVIGLLLLFNIVLTAANVFSRYVIHQSWSFTEEVVVALLVLMSLMGAALCERDRGGLINLTLFTGKMPPKARLIVEIIMTVLLIYFGVVMVRYGIQRCISQADTNRLTTSLQIPEWYYSSFVPIGGGLLVLHSVERILDCIYELLDLKKGKGADAQ